MKPLVAIVIMLCAAAIAVGAWAAMARGSPGPAGSGTWDPADPELGRKAYAVCLGCHGLDGRGVPGYAPPLAASRWLAEERAAVLIALHGYDATSEPGSAYVSSRMLGHAHQLTDAELAALLTWARSQWGNTAGPVPTAAVSALRARFASRTTPWSPAELRALEPRP